MTQAELRESWKGTVRLLAASRFCLSEYLEHPEAQRAEQEMNHYLHHREYGLALQCAEVLGQVEDAPSEYWLELKLAAQNMGLAEEAARYAKLANPSSMGSPTSARN